MKRLIVVALLLAPVTARAHVGEQDVVHEGLAGPYRLLVSVKPPQVIPGVAEVQVLSSDTDVTRIELVPLPLTGDGAKLAPTPDVAQRVKDTAQSYTGRVWMMSAGSWQVKVHAVGARGAGDLSVPVPALPQRTRAMHRGLALALFLLVLFLGLGAASIAGASVREAQLPPGQSPDGRRRKKALLVTVAAGSLIALALYGGDKWWDSEAQDYDNYVYKPVQMEAAGDAQHLTLSLHDPGWLRTRRVDDLVPDHNHLMHLFMVRVPELDRVFHLHPEQTGDARFQNAMPAVPAGRYQLFADIVHSTGLAETAVAELQLPDQPGAPLGPDDATGPAPPISSADRARRECPLASGGRVVWLKDAAPFAAGKVDWLRFRVDEADGQPTKDLELYMGMLGHAAIVAHDRTLFAHIHPTGSVPMASLAVAAGNTGDPHAGHHMDATGLPSEIHFPYSFPKPGRYRVFVQFSRRHQIETAAFDADVL
jgi:hypothetical protein